ncbi:uncharacterized protein LOC130717400 [Lotus japonicus]|uniref:uncharacterized protein LOC130717400 n=1 Tax=Lotus japonicus TaxID=34305 RepID=UPI002585C4D0|nr:uncharacterized protein LOC130717400 [Lotus japonicus]
MDSDHAWLKVGWRLPPSNFLKLNVDGSSATNSDQMGWGGAIRDAAGNWIQGFQSNSKHNSTFVAEAMALRDGLTTAKNHGSRQLLCESDCNTGEWIHRDGNATADWLARRGCRAINQGTMLLNSLPPELEVILLQDMFGVV